MKLTFFPLLVIISVFPLQITQGTKCPKKSVDEEKLHSEFKQEIEEGHPNMGPSCKSAFLEYLSSCSKIISMPHGFEVCFVIKPFAEKLFSNGICTDEDLVDGDYSQRQLKSPRKPVHHRYLKFLKCSEEKEGSCTDDDVDLTVEEAVDKVWPNLSPKCRSAYLETFTFCMTPRFPGAPRFNQVSCTKKALTMNFSEVCNSKDYCED